jgi:hypothetical protein
MVFERNFDNLKRMFYILNRLIQILLPELAARLKKQKIDPHFFATSWMITLFTQCYQYTGDSLLLDIIWDFFLVQEWKGFYKCLLFIMKFYAPKMLVMDFESILNLMSELIRSDLLTFSREQVE